MAKKPKPPKNIPTRQGQRVWLRKSPRKGTVLKLYKIKSLSNQKYDIWCRVEWDDNFLYPDLCHQNELIVMDLVATYSQVEDQLAKLRKTKLPGVNAKTKAQQRLLGRD